MNNPLNHIKHQMVQIYKQSSRIIKVINIINNLISKVMGHSGKRAP